jgi:hypothetical protein
MFLRPKADQRVKPFPPNRRFAQQRPTNCQSSIVHCQVRRVFRIVSTVFRRSNRRRRRRRRLRRRRRHRRVRATTKRTFPLKKIKARRMDRFVLNDGFFYKR